MTASSSAEQIRWWGNLARLQTAIDLAELRCTPTSDIIEHIDSLLDGEYPTGIINFLADHPPADIDLQHQIADKLDHLVELGMERRGEPGRRVDRALFRLIRLVPPQRARSLGIRLVQGSRVRQRQAGYRAFRLSGLDRELVELLLPLYAEHRDREALWLLAGSPEELPAGECAELLRSSRPRRTEQLAPFGAYARLIERLLKVDTELAVGFAKEFPAEAAWAIGRSRDAAWLPLLRSLYDEASDDPSFVSLYVWAAGVIGSPADLEPARRLVRAKEAEFNAVLGSD